MRTRQTGCAAEAVRAGTGVGGDDVRGRLRPSRTAGRLRATAAGHNRRATLSHRPRTTGRTAAAAATAARPTTTAGHSNDHARLRNHGRSAAAGARARTAGAACANKRNERRYAV